MRGDIPERYISTYRVPHEQTRLIWRSPNLRELRPESVPLSMRGSNAFLIVLYPDDVLALFH
jgi:hypothetical protein